MATVTGGQLVARMLKKEGVRQIATSRQQPTPRTPTRG